MRQTDLPKNCPELTFLALNIHLPDIIGLTGMVDRHQEFMSVATAGRISTSGILHLIGLDPNRDNTGGELIPLIIGDHQS